METRTQEPTSSAWFRPLLADRICARCGAPSTFVLRARYGVGDNALSACCAAPEKQLRAGGADHEGK